MKLKLTSQNAIKKILILILIGLGQFTFAQSNINWSPPIGIAASHFGNDHPRITLDGSGDPMVIWSKNQAIFFAKWNGNSFNTPLKLNPAGLTTASASWMGPDIAAHGDTVYIVAKRTPESVDSNRIFIFTSFDGGNSFDPPLELGFIADSFSRFPTVETDAGGQPIVGYMKFNSEFLESRWVVTRSDDFGKTFSTDVRASGWGDSYEVCDCCPGAIISEDNRTAILYRDNNDNIRDIWAGISTNNAATFSIGMEVDDNNWMIMNCPASGPDGVIIGDTLYATFMNGSSGKTRNYFSKSSIVTGELSSVVPLTENIPGLSQQNFPRIEKDGNSIALVWQQNVNGQSQLPILFTEDINSGLPPVYDTVAAGDIVNADVAIAGGKIYVIWEEFGTEIVKFRSGTYSQVSSTKDKFINNTLSLYPNPVTTTLNFNGQIKMSNAEIIIINTLGNIVFSANNIRENKVDVSYLAEGIYFILVRFGDQYSTQKFVKQ